MPFHTEFVDGNLQCVEKVFQLPVPFFYYLYQFFQLIMTGLRTTSESLNIVIRQGTSCSVSIDELIKLQIVDKHQVVVV